MSVPPIQLSQSPVHEAFHGIVGDPLQKLSLSAPEIALLQAAEANPLEYTLSDQHDAEAYAHVLLKVIDQCTTSNKASNSKSKHVPAVAKLSLSQSPLQDDEALQLLYVDTMGVVLHYAISKLTAVIQALLAMNNNSSSNRGKNSSRRKKKTTVVSVASIFYPTATATTSSRHIIVLKEHCRRPLKQLLTGSRSDAYAQRGAAVCLAWILAAGLELSSAQQEASNKQNHKEEEEEDPLFGLVSAPLPAMTTTTTATTTTEDNDTTTSLLNSMESFVSWMTSRLASAKNSSDLAIVLPALMVLMPSSPVVRQAFDRAGGLAYLSRHLRVAKPTTMTTIHSSSDDLYLSSSAFDNGGSSSIANTFMRTTTTSNNNTRVSVQQLYELTYVVWLLSFDCCDVTKDRLRKHFYRDGVVSHLVDLVIAKPREKVVRVALATLKNLAQCHEQQPVLTTMRIDSSSNGKSLAAANEKVDVDASKVSKATSSGSFAKSSPQRKQQLSGDTAVDSSGLTSPLEALKLSPTTSPRKRRTVAENGTAFSSSSSLIYKSPSKFITGHDFCKEMVACGLLKPMDRMLAAAADNNSKMTDPDVLEDLQILREILNYTFQHMTSWDVYVSEIESTHLQWGIVHTEQFFRENVKRLEGKDGKFGIVRVCVVVVVVVVLHSCFFFFGWLVGCCFTAWYPCTIFLIPFVANAHVCVCIDRH